MRLEFDRFVAAETDPYKRGVELASQFGQSIHIILLNLLGNNELSSEVMSLISRLLANSPDHIVQEIHGIADTIDVEPEKVAFFSVMDDILRTIDESTPVLGCSSICCVSDDGLLVGRNLDYGICADTMRDSCTQLSWSKADKKVWSWTWPGYQGVVTGFNSAGLWLAGHVSYSSQRSNLSSIPSGFLFRGILEECSRLSEVEAYLDSYLPASAVNIAAAQLNHAEAAVYEVDSNTWKRRNPEDGKMVCTNHFLERPGWMSDNSSLRYSYLNTCSPRSFPELSQIMGLWGINNGLTVYSIIYEGGRFHDAISHGRPTELEYRESVTFPWP